MKTINDDQLIWNQLSKAAWECRDNAYILGNTKVGAALYSKSSVIYTGCNVEHMYRCHDIHAEVNAISTMIAHGEQNFLAILIVAERHKFTPCGGCMDWIMQHGGKDCLVGYQNQQNGPIVRFTAGQLMPEYPA